MKKDFFGFGFSKDKEEKKKEDEGRGFFGFRQSEQAPEEEEAPGAAFVNVETAREEIENSVERLDNEAEEWVNAGPDPVISPERKIDEFAEARSAGAQHAQPQGEAAGSVVYGVQPKVYGGSQQTYAGGGAQSGAYASYEEYQDGAGVPEPEPEKGISLISQDTYIDGNIITEGHIEVRGSVKGDIRAKGNVSVTGAIKGDIEGDKIGLYSCKIRGDLHAGTGIVEDAGSVIIGDVDTANIIMDGKLKGDIRADNVVVLRNNAYYLGNVVAGSIAIENGAVISGSITTLIEGDPEAPFEML